MLIKATEAMSTFLQLGMTKAIHIPSTGGTRTIQDNLSSEDKGEITYTQNMVDILKLDLRFTSSTHLDDFSSVPEISAAALCCPEPFGFF